MPVGGVWKEAQWHIPHGVFQGGGGGAASLAIYWLQVGGMGYTPSAGWGGQHGGHLLIGGGTKWHV